MIRKFIIFWGVCLLLIPSAFAKRFSSQYCEFELAPGWNCNLEGSEWVCQNESNADRKKEAIIILAAKERGEEDSQDKYLAYLKKAKTFSLPGGKVQVSEAKYAELKKIGDQTWIDSLHLASEVPGFYTRYLATIKEDLGIAVTFSVSKESYQDYQKIFDLMIESLRVFRQTKVDPSKYALKKDDKLLDNSVFIPDTDQPHDLSGNSGKKVKGSSGAGSAIWVIIIALGVAGFVLIKFKKKKKKAKK
ncbi:MAG: hypothetical protein A2451_04450 [Bdellovibrionales bacterium RIFOXYC2_FULL_39_8]|nr:MAG: hypothetical protein A2485_13435 [Bdellovibrionales bacterium RIFOXYC12_FULL_39_17]OFZ47032.1 MAG: hypothetical protein A2404_00495 [Bdellovibrionales bacterium RIFOXYC1_FULL_39_130]OFZ73361.1 MAG: hypothetical protein A2451_04450 [Bdellovibrionales bacterium RIFOXYC2_FULL_39_8]OFZ76229.1 MAG: hypothetical protein A2560_07745 [Bdellovibrionales bacterium RIFOXYD1_FULL_39_84]HLE11496.1 hypothetical protein [Bacteriovoracaceae bacterium]